MSVAQTAPPSAPAGSETAKLHRRALGVPDLVFFIVAASAPLTAVAGGQAATYLVTGNRGVAFMFIPLGIVLGLFAVGYAAMSRHVANAGAFYAYVARGLGKVQGVGAAFMAMIAYNAMQIGIYGLFGVAMGAFMADKLGITLEWYWWCVIAGGVIGLLGVLQIDLNARVLAVLLILEVIVVALFDLAIVADPGPQGLTTVAFDPTVAFGIGGRRHADVLRRVVRRLRVGRDLQRGVPRSQAHRRPRDVHRRRPDRGLLRALELAARRRRRPGHDGQPRRARRRGLHLRQRPGPDHGAVHHRPGPARRVLGRLRLAAVRHVAVRRAAVLPQRGLALHVRARARGRAAAGVRAREPEDRRAVDRLARRRRSSPSRS